MALTSDRGTIARFPAAFYTANVMEIFERLAWYGFFTVSSLYITAPARHGGLGFSEQQRGMLQGMIPFLLYVLPVFTGAFADRYGYRKALILSLSLMGPGYFLLGQVHTFASFALVFALVAIGAATFKPIAVGTVARTTDDTNRGVGFGIFYMMVNIGGFLGPVVAGYVRAIGWDMVFIMSAAWICVNFFPAIFIYREPRLASASRGPETAGIFQSASEVLGNMRLLLFVAPIVIAMLAALHDGVGWRVLGVFVCVWTSINLAWTRLVRHSASSRWYRQRIAVGDARFIAYLLVLSVFWAAYYQVFLTLPLYIRDYVDTGDLVAAMSSISPSVAGFASYVDLGKLAGLLSELQNSSAALDSAGLDRVRESLLALNVHVPQDELVRRLAQLRAPGCSAHRMAEDIASQFRQIHPEYLINIEFLLIVGFQLAVSMLARKLPVLPVLVAGFLLLACALAMIGGSRPTGALIVAGLIVFAFAEMVVSPKSQEYVAAIAPGNKAATFMGFYFVSMALGNLFAGPLSGWAYSSMKAGALSATAMWLVFGGVALVPAVGMVALHTARR